MTHGTKNTQAILSRLRGGDSSARDELIAHTRDRLLRLTRKMLRAYPGVRRWEQTDDVFQNAVVRLLRALHAVSVPSVQAFFALAAEQVRRELIDLARHYYGPRGHGAHHDSQADGDLADRAAAAMQDGRVDAGGLMEWTEFHTQAGLLPGREREVFDLLYYHGSTQVDAAAILGMDVSTVQRRWGSAVRLLRSAMKGEMPGT